MSALVLFVSCLAGAILPVFGSEVVVLAAAALAEGPTRVAVIALAAGAQSVGKLFVYSAAAAGASTRAAEGFGVAALKDAMERSRSYATVLVFLSALASLPPLYATTLVCGVARYGRLPFGIAVFAARVLRYGGLVALADPSQFGLLP